MEGETFLMLMNLLNTKVKLINCYLSAERFLLTQFTLSILGHAQNQ